MGKLTAAESWLSRLGLAKPRTHHPPNLGVVSFEVATLMTRAAHLWRSLSDDRIAHLRHHALRLEGVCKLVSDDDNHLLSLALAELLDSLSSLSLSLPPLASRCSHPLLRRLSTPSPTDDLLSFQYAPAKMDRKVKKMERLAAATAALYQELEVLAELEQSLGRAHQRKELAHRVAWQRQQVRSLRDSSLWACTHDYAARLLARSLFTIAARIRLVFGSGAAPHLARTVSVSGPIRSSSELTALTRFASGPLARPTSRITAAVKETRRPKTKWTISGKPLSGCMVGGNDSSPVLQSCVPVDRRWAQHASGGNEGSPFIQSCIPVDRRQHRTRTPRIANSMSEPQPENPWLVNVTLFGSKRKLLEVTPASSLGAAALGLHYANVIVVIEKFSLSPHLIGMDARNDLYNMLPYGIRAALRAKLKPYAKSLVYDPVLAAEWADAMSRIMEWLSPLAHNMIKWQSEHNFEQQHLAVPATNILLLQTLHFADQAKTEATITELLVGLNYLWRFGREFNAKGTKLECVGG